MTSLAGPRKGSLLWDSPDPSAPKDVWELRCDPTQDVSDRLNLVAEGFRVLNLSRPDL